MSTNYHFICHDCKLKINTGRITDTLEVINSILKQHENHKFNIYEDSDWVDPKYDDYKYEDIYDYQTEKIKKKYLTEPEMTMSDYCNLNNKYNIEGEGIIEKYQNNKDDNPIGKLLDHFLEQRKIYKLNTKSMKLAEDCRLFTEPDICTIKEAAKWAIKRFQYISRKIRKDNNKGYRLLGQPNVKINGYRIPITKGMDYLDIINYYNLMIEKADKYKKESLIIRKFKEAVSVGESHKLSYVSDHMIRFSPTLANEITETGRNTIRDTMISYAKLRGNQENKNRLLIRPNTLLNEELDKLSSVEIEAIPSLVGVIDRLGPEFTKESLLQKCMKEFKEKVINEDIEGIMCGDPMGIRSPSINPSLGIITPKNINDKIFLDFESDFDFAALYPTAGFYTIGYNKLYGYEKTEYNRQKLYEKLKKLGRRIKKRRRR